MAAKRPTSKSTEVTPTEADGTVVTPAVVVDDPTPAAPDSFSVVPATEPAVTDGGAPAAETAAPETPARQVAPAQQVIYVEAPKPFVAKGNRAFGVVIALVSTLIFAALLALADVIAEAINGTAANLGFITDLDFYAPVILFAVGFILLVLIVNRAGWAAHVIGSIFVGLVVFFGGTGLILLLHINQIPSNEVGKAFSQVLFSSGLIVAALLGREVALWMGFAIAARGRKVKARNVEARVLYDQEIAAKRAEYEQANARSAGAPASEAPVVEEPAVEEPVVAKPVVAKK
jgi:hypothetical protein